MTYRGMREVTTSQDAVKKTQFIDWIMAIATTNPRTTVMMPSIDELKRLARIHPGMPTVIAGGAGLGLVDCWFIDRLLSDAGVSGNAVVDVSDERVEEAHCEVCDHDHTDERDCRCDLGHGGGYADEIGVSDGGCKR